MYLQMENLQLKKKDINLKFRGSSNQRIINVDKTLKNKKIFLLDEYMKYNLDEAK